MREEEREPTGHSSSEQTGSDRRRSGTRGRWDESSWRVLPPPAGRAALKLSVHSGPEMNGGSEGRSGTSGEVEAGARGAVPMAERRRLAGVKSAGIRPPSFNSSSHDGRPATAGGPGGRGQRGGGAGHQNPISECDRLEINPVLITLVMLSAASLPLLGHRTHAS